jgi:NAD(P)-dependent dehydrogenase (short-subunit alcohol dehydrogenase family)
MTQRNGLPLVATLLMSVLAGSAVSADTVLVTGANSGLGLEFVKQYAAKGWTVIATHRRSGVPESLAPVVAAHPNVRVERMDVSSLTEIEALASKLRAVPIDVLINNAGIFSDRSACTAEDCGGRVDTQVFGSLDFDLLDTMMTVNVRGPLAVSQHFIDHVRASGQKKIVAISSTNGSVSEPLPGAYAVSYRASKAALNRAMQLVALQEQPNGVTVLLLHPGTVATERVGDSDPESIEVTQSVTGMIAQIEKVTIEDTGRFIQYDGAVVPW